MEMQLRKDGDKKKKKEDRRPKDEPVSKRRELINGVWHIVEFYPDGHSGSGYERSYPDPDDHPI